jgi:hypothetical protein
MFVHRIKLTLNKGLNFMAVTTGRTETSILLIALAQLGFTRLIISSCKKPLLKTEGLNFTKMSLTERTHKDAETA